MQFFNARLFLKIARKMFFALSFLVLGEAKEIEVVLNTKDLREPIYLTRIHLPSSEYDWRYFEELREVLQFDLNTNGRTTVVSVNDAWEDQWKWPDVRSRFDVTAWQEKQIPYVVAIQAIDHRLQVIVFQTAKEVVKKYPELTLTGNALVDRKGIHQLADAIHQDLFGMKGIASLRILYTKRYKVNEVWQSDIWVADSDGVNARPLIEKQGYCVSPSFFPGQEDRFYYICFHDGQSKIYTASLQQPKGEPLVSLRGNQLLPCVNAKGDRLAFISDAAGRPDLFIQKLDPKGKAEGKARQVFSAPRSTQASPTFSPDGKQIAFVSDKDGSPRVYIMPIEGVSKTQKPSPRLITKRNRENSCPAWSPDGKKIAYSAKVDGIRQIWIYDVVTEEEKSLTMSPCGKENPSWAPDSLHLMYNTEDQDTCELYRLHIANQDSILVGSGGEQHRFPSMSSLNLSR